MVPHVALPVGTASTSQVMVVVVEVVELLRVTTAVKSACPATLTEVLVGLIETELTVVVVEPPPQEARHKMPLTARNATSLGVDFTKPDLSGRRVAHNSSACFQIEVIVSGAPNLLCF
jgi:hypothetical protein